MTTRTHHPLANIAEWRKGCSCAPKEFPVQCEACTEGLIKAIESWFTQDRNASTDVLGSLRSFLIADARTGGKRKSTEMVNMAYQHIEDLDAELYALQDQVAGLQELMRQRDELLAKCRKTQKRLVEVADPILQNHGVSVGYFGAAERNVAAIDAMFPGVFAEGDDQ